MSVLDAWQMQVDTHIKSGLLKVIMYHGPNRARNPDDLTACDIVLTTYDVLASEFMAREANPNPKAKANPKKRKAESVLESIHWHRVVLDEAHIIRNMSTVRYKACAQLEATYRWCVTGTPVQNSVADLQSQVQFLRLQPFHTDTTLFSRYLTRPIKAGDPQAVGKNKNNPPI